jgi:YHS domain-containing protein
MRLLIFAALAYLIYRIFRHYLNFGDKTRKTENSGVIDEMVRDPFCDTYIPVRDAKRRIINGREYFFCSEACADKFQKEKEG